MSKYGRRARAGGAWARGPVPAVHTLGGGPRVCVPRKSLPGPWAARRARSRGWDCPPGLPGQVQGLRACSGLIWEVAAHRQRLGPAPSASNPRQALGPLLPRAPALSRFLGSSAPGVPRLSRPSPPRRALSLPRGAFSLEWVRTGTAGRSSRKAPSRNLPWVPTVRPVPDSGAAVGWPATEAKAPAGTFQTQAPSLRGTRGTHAWGGPCGCQAGCASVSYKQLSSPLPAPDLAGKEPEAQTTAQTG